MTVRSSEDVHLPVDGRYHQHQNNGDKVLELELMGPFLPEELSLADRLEISKSELVVSICAGDNHTIDVSMINFASPEGAAI